MATSNYQQDSQPGTVEPPTPASQLTQTKWHKPNYTLPLPSLQFLFHLECDMDSFRHIGIGPHGDRSTVIFKGGRFEGPLLRGTILPGGGDWEIITNHDDIQTAHLDTRYNLLTDDGETIYLQTTGTRTGKRDVLERLGEDGSIGAGEYRMRLTLKIQAAQEGKYGWLNDGVFVASSGRSGDMVIYDAYQLL